MNLRNYYHKIRETEQALIEPFVVVVSLETPDGGRAGVRTEVQRHIAAKMIVENRARLASSEEAQEFHEHKTESKRVADHLEAAGRVQVTVLSENDLRHLKGALKGAK